MSRLRLPVTFFLVIIVAIAAQGLAPVKAGWDPTLEQKAREAIAEFKAADPSMEVFFEQAYGYVVFPHVGKGAIGIGGAHGDGVVFEQGKAVGLSTLTKISIGLQLGGQAYREVIFFKDKAALERFKAGSYVLDAEASAVAVEKGASAATDYAEGVAVFTMAKGGLMFEASVGGQEFTYEPK